MLVVAWVYQRAQINKVAITMLLHELINLINNTVTEMVQISHKFQCSGLYFFFSKEIPGFSHFLNIVIL